MVNNYYACTIHHKRKRTKSSYDEKIILYSEDNNNFIDLEKNRCYTTDETKKVYVIESSIVPIDITDYKIDYKYLLIKKKKNK